MMALDEFVVRTPLLEFRGVQGARIYLKPENLQPFGSYKIRGVASVFSRVSHERFAKGISAASAGNMAQSVAFAAGVLGVRARIFVPESAPEVKKSAIRKQGAELIELPFQEIWEYVQGRRGVEDGSFFVHPAFTSELVQGYEAIADEILEDLADVDAIVVPFGVGGLSLGIARAVKRARRDVAIYTCEPETAAPFHQSLRLGRASSVERVPSFVDAIGTPEVLPPVFEELAPGVSGGLIGTLEDTRVALKELRERNKLICEGAAGVALATSKELARAGRHRKIACILSGGNAPAEFS